MQSAFQLAPTTTTATNSTRLNAPFIAQARCELSERSRESSGRRL